MFDGVPDQLHQFIASSRTGTNSSLPLPLPLSSFPLHHASPSPNTTFPPFDIAYSHHQVPLQPHHPHQVLLQPLHHNPPPAQKINHEDKEENNLVINSVNLEIDDDDRDRSSILPEPIAPPPPWSNDEVLALLRIRSTMENWFPDFTWEHISRKLAELGYKRSAEKCKEKFEEESRYFNNINYIKNYRFLTELEELYHGDHHHHQNPQVLVGAEKSQKVLVVEKASERKEEEEDKLRGQSVEKESENNNEEKMMMMMMMEERALNRKKRKRHKNFEIFKGFCEDIVNRMMAQQEEMHNKLLEDMLKRDEEKVAKEEAWKKQEIVRMNKELETMAHEQALAGDRQATMIDFLKKFTIISTSSSSSSGGKILKSFWNPIIIPPTTSSSSIQPPQNPNPTSTTTVAQEQPIVSSENPSSNPTTTPTINPKLPTAPSTSPVLASKNPNSPSSTQKALPQNPSSNEKDGIGKRWPRDEVLALINLRCSLYNSSSGEDKEGGVVKAPLWERISQGMVELGYKRSAKRCKEKWENINKYFRKTKDNVNKKRSLDSRTCPYFHQLSTLYNNQGTTIAAPPPPPPPPPPQVQEQQHCSAANSPESHSSALPETGRGGGLVGSSSTADSSCLHDHHHHHHQGERNMVHVSSAFDFEF